MNNCNWMTTDLERRYHETEWCVPKYDDVILFEFLILEMMQAGLSWAIILNKREAMREAFSGFDIDKISKYAQSDKDRLLDNKGIIRNRLKINSLVSNAQKFIEIQEEYGTFAKYIWEFVNNKPINNKFKTTIDMPATSDISDIISKDLKKRGFKFVGSTICYSYMQAIGMINDHLVGCEYYNCGK